MDIQIGDVSHIIQLAIAPVFLLTGVGTNLMVLTSRLARIIDRSRILEGHVHNMVRTDPQDERCDQIEIEMLYQRAHLINRAITLSTACALLICIVIVALFVGGAFSWDFGQLIALLFVLAMLSLTGSLVYLLREILIATKILSLRRYVVPDKK